MGKSELQDAVNKRKESVEQREMEMSIEAKKAANLRAGRKSSDLFDSDEDMSETESEWEKERNEKKKAEKEQMEQLELQMKLKEEEMERQKKAYQEKLENEKRE